MIRRKRYNPSSLLRWKPDVKFFESKMIAEATVSSIPDTERELFKSLRALCEQGVLRIEIDPRRLDHIDSPLVVEADSNRWAYALLALTAIVWWQAGIEAGVAAGIVSVAVYYTAGRRYVTRRIEARLENTALQDLTIWRKLWRFGGVSLVVGSRRCGAPDGNWMAFVRDCLTP
jgi:hypothetical protein